LGLKEWSVGGTKAIYAYDPEQYERERTQREEMGFQDAFGTGNVMIDGVPAYNGEDGYDNSQMVEEDY
jgi:hypothetical protein